MPFSVCADEDLTWPEKAPDANLGYAFDITGELDPGDTPTGASVSISPSGEGSDLVIWASPVVPKALYMDGNVMTVWLAGGVPGRVYLLDIKFTTADGSTLAFLVSLPIVRTLAAWPPFEPPTDPIFSTPVTWP